MAKGRKANNALPECECGGLTCVFTTMKWQYSVVQLSADGKKVRCKTCANESVRAEDLESSWIKKESLTYHLKSNHHTRSVIAQRERELLQSAGEQSIREEIAMEQEMDFITLASTSSINQNTKKSTQVRIGEEAKNMWDNFQFLEEVFDIGTDHNAIAIEERKRLIKQANDFDIWQAADFLPDEDPNGPELILDELEQDDILTELMRNASKSIQLLFLFTCLYA